MRIIRIIVPMLAAVLISGCGTVASGLGTTAVASKGTNILGGVLGAITNGEAVGNVISSIIGTDKLTQEQLIGTWNYEGPGCAFTSENALAKAGGEVAATSIEEKLESTYSKVGFTSANTTIVFNEDGTFSSKIAGKSWTGKYTFDESTGQLNLSGLLLNLNGYAKRSTNGISVLFESKKILTLLQTVASLTNNQSLDAISEISKNYDGVRLGFDMKK